MRRRSFVLAGIVGAGTLLVPLRSEADIAQRIDAAVPGLDATTRAMAIARVKDGADFEEQLRRALYASDRHGGLGARTFPALRYP